MEALIKCSFNIAHNALGSSHVLHHFIMHEEAIFFISIRYIKPCESKILKSTRKTLEF